MPLSGRHKLCRPQKPKRCKSWVEKWMHANAHQATSSDEELEEDGDPHGVKCCAMLCPASTLIHLLWPCPQDPAISYDEVTRSLLSNLSRALRYVWRCGWNKVCSKSYVPLTWLDTSSKCMHDARGSVLMRLVSAGDRFANPKFQAWPTCTGGDALDYRTCAPARRNLILCAGKAEGGGAKF